ncbi:hypothetical protein BDV19DRAFT_383502 [Aspergillus venezuelensis]
MERKCFKNLGHLDPFQDGFTIFNGEDLYGQSFEIQDPSKKEEVLSRLSGSIEAGLCVPQSTGKLILRQQIGLLQALIKKRPAETSFEELLSQALDQRNCLDNYVMLCRREPVFLTHVVNSWFYRHIFQFVTTDKYISFAIFEVLQNVLLQELATKLSDRRCKAVILQELANRFAQTGLAFKYFNRVTGTNNDDVTNPQIHYVLRLCQHNLDAASAATWIKRLDDDFAVVTCFFQTLIAWQTYVAKSNNIDLGEFVVPFDNLLKAGMSNGTLTTLDQSHVEKTGTELGFLYQGLNEDCLACIWNQYYELKATVAAVPDASYSSKYSILPVLTTTEPESAEAVQVFKVKPATFQVFTTLFSGKQSRGSIVWTAFEAAMADLQFSVTLNMGLVITFYLPKNLPSQRPLTLHRPHQARLEGHQLLFIASRLKRAFGWGRELFKMV